MTSIQFVVHPLPGTQEQLAEKLKSVADRLNRYGLQGNYWLILKKGGKSKFVYFQVPQQSLVSGRR